MNRPGPYVLTLTLTLITGAAGVARAEVVLWNNGPLVNEPFAGAGGAHVSRVQSELGLASLTIHGNLTGPTGSFGTTYADDFVVATPGGWHVTSLTMFAAPVAAGGGMPAAVLVSVYDSPPWTGVATPIFSASVPATFVATGTYRVPGDDLSSTDFPITSVQVFTSLVLSPGQYWLAWRFNPGPPGGPLFGAPPVTRDGQTTTGDARIFQTSCEAVPPPPICFATWSGAADAGQAHAPQGLPFLIKGRPVSARKGDFDGQGGADLLFRNVNPASADFNRNKVWYLDGVVRWFEAFVTPDPPGPQWSIVGTDDFDTAGAPWNGPDGKTDLLFRDSTTGELRFWLMDGPDRVGESLPLSGASARPLTWRVAATADFDGDAKPDIVWRNLATQKIEIWTMDGTTLSGTVVPSPDQALNANWSIVAAQDYDDDGFIDLLWHNSNSGNVVIWHMDAVMQRLSGQFVDPPSAGNNNWKVMASGDYSHIYEPGVPPLNSPDLVWRNEASGKTVVWHLDYKSTRLLGQFTMPESNTPAIDWTVVGPR